MTLLLKLGTIGFFIGLLVIGSLWLPPFPPAFEEWLTVMFTRILLLDTWLPVRLLISLMTVIVGVELAAYLWRVGKWFKSFVMGEPRA